MIQADSSFYWCAKMVKADSVLFVLFGWVVQIAHFRMPEAPLWLDRCSRESTCLKTEHPITEPRKHLTQRPAVAVLVIAAGPINFGRCTTARPQLAVEHSRARLLGPQRDFSTQNLAWRIIRYAVRHVKGIDTLPCLFMHPPRSLLSFRLTSSRHIIPCMERTMSRHCRHS